jgi:hypothetical protein
MAAACRTCSAQPRPMHRRYRPNDNTLRGLVVRNGAGSALLHLLTAVRGLKLLTLAMQQISGYLRYTGRAAKVVVKTALDPKRQTLEIYCHSALTMRY